jgi:RHS repeat-associated protein
MNPSPAIGNTKSGNNAGDALLWAAGTTETMYYVHKDYASATLSTGLGSISAITDATGNLVESLSYDAWGRRRNPTNWTDYNVTATLFDRGYTGHEHLPHFGLINMNGRVYDPFLARFLSPDPFVQAPGYTQNYNRYSYAWNNPLKYTDPSGELVFTLLAAVFAPPLLPIAIGADIGWITGGIRGAKSSDHTFLGGAWRGAVVGAAGGALSMVGGGTFIANIAWGLGQGAFTGGLDALLWGEDIKRSAMIGAAFGAGFAAVTSGIEAFKNLNEFDEFGTNIGVFNRMAKDVQNAYLNNDYSSLQSAMKNINDFSSSRFGFYSNMEFGGTVSAASPDGRAAVGFFDRTIKSDGTSGLVKRSGSAIRRSMEHESAHLRNIIVNYDGKGALSEISRTFFRGGKLAINGVNHGTVGYYEPIRRAGVLHIGSSIVEQTRPGTVIAWKQFGWEKWLYLIPRRY